jgi:hypothetical protein
MACLTTYQGLCRHDLEDELNSPRTRLVHGDYALVPLASNRREHSDYPLSHYINNDSALSPPCALRHRAVLRGVTDAAAIDRQGPFGYSSYTPRCRSAPQPYDDAEYFDVPRAGWRFPHTYPLQCIEPGGSRWSPEQIHAYNRDVVRHNNQIASRRMVGVPSEYMMLHPMMDPLGRFPPGFDRPWRLDEFLAMDGKQRPHLFKFPLSISSSCKPRPLNSSGPILLCCVEQLLTCSAEPLIDSHRHHYGLPQPENLEKLLLLNSHEQNLRRQLKQVQLLELYGAKHLAEQFAIQLLASQNALPGLSAPRSPGYGLGPDFDDDFLSPLRRDQSGAIPLDALGYGSGLSNWNLDLLPQLRAAMAGRGGRGLGPWAGAGGASPWARSGIYPGMGSPRGYGAPGSWPGLPYSGGAWGGGIGGYDPRGRGIGSGPSDMSRFMERISCDGGVGRRHGSF